MFYSNLDLADAWERACRDLPFAGDQKSTRPREAELIQPFLTAFTGSSNTSTIGSTPNR